jgi:hypothetical protein
VATIESNGTGMQDLLEPVVPMPPGSQPLHVLESHCPVFYTAAETSKIVRLDESTLYRHLRNGTFPGVKIGGRYVVPHAVLERLISDVLATGRCVDLAEWTERWRSEQEARVQRLTVSQPVTTVVANRGGASVAGAATG